MGDRDGGEGGADRQSETEGQTERKREMDRSKPHLKVSMVDRVEANQCGKQTNIRFRQLITDKIAALGQNGLHLKT